MSVNDTISLVMGILFIFMIAYFLYRNYQFDKKYANKLGKH